MLVEADKIFFMLLIILILRFDINRRIFLQNLIIKFKKA